MHVESRVLLQPTHHLLVLVRAIVVGNQVEVDIFGSLAVDLLEETQPLHVRVLLFGAVDQLALQVAQSCEQRDGAMPDVVVCPRPDMAVAQRQARLRALQGLALRLLVAAQHQRPRGWIQIETHHIPELLFELLVPGDLERAQKMRLEPLALPDARHAVGRDADLPSQRAGAPALPAWRRLARLLDHPPDRGQRNRRLRPAARLVLEAVEPCSVKALRPLAHARGAHAQARRHLLLPEAFATQQNDVRPEAVTRRSRRGSDPTFQLPFLLGGYLKYRDRTCHRTPPARRE